MISRELKELLEYLFTDVIDMLNAEGTEKIEDEFDNCTNDLVEIRKELEEMDK